MPDRKLTSAIAPVKPAAGMDVDVLEGSVTKALNAMLIPEPNSGQMRAAQNKTKVLIVAAFLCGIAAVALLPQAIESGWLLLVQDDPAALADRKLVRSFNAEVATREIEAALAANDPDLAKSFVELARDRNVPLTSDLTAKVDAAVAKANG